MENRTPIRRFYFQNQDIKVTCFTDDDEEFILNCPITGQGELYKQHDCLGLDLTKVELNGESSEGTIDFSSYKIDFKRSDSMSIYSNTINILAYNWQGKKPEYKVVIRTDLKEDEFKGLYNAIRTELKMSRSDYDKHHSNRDAYEPEAIIDIMKERRYIEVLEDEVETWQVGR